jgi:hypothetical protein
MTVKTENTQKHGKRFLEETVQDLSEAGIRDRVNRFTFLLLCLENAISGSWRVRL